MSDKPRVFITGMGIISPLGLDADTTWEQLTKGKSGIDFITAFDTEGFDKIRFEQGQLNLILLLPR